MPSVREVLAGRYELLEVRGRGGMGVVFRGRDRVLERVVAVKVLAAERAEDETFVARFEREARAAAALSHPNIAAVFDTGRDDMTRFNVMEWVAGLSLAERVRRDGRLPPAQASGIAAAIADALEAAHSVGIIHRDIKPANVMVGDRDAVKVLDLGIARAASDVSLTQTAMMLGSAPYVAPEVAHGRRADERSDIYSLGCLLYELLTGRPPFTGELPAAVVHQHISAVPRPPRELNPGVPAALDALVLQLLAKSPRARPQSARQVAQALRRPAHRSTPAPADPVADPSVPPTYVLARAHPFRPAAKPALAIVAVLACLGVVLLLVGSSSPRHRGRKPRVAPTRPAQTSTAHASAALTHQSAESLPQTRTSSTIPAATPPTVPAAAAELTRLATQDLTTATIDPPASQQILARLPDILNTYDNGNTNDITHKLDDFSQQVTQLAQHGDIQAAALPAITRTLDELRSALIRGMPADTKPGPAPQPPPQQPPKPPKPPHH